MVEQSADYRLNPVLQRGCSQDIGKFCLSLMKNHIPDIEFEGRILNCLKVSLQFEEEEAKKCNFHHVAYKYSNETFQSKTQPSDTECIRIKICLVQYHEISLCEYVLCRSVEFGLNKYNHYFICR
jgi:hypothetical protein